MWPASDNIKLILLCMTFKSHAKAELLKLSKQNEHAWPHYGKFE